jgi:hypothetical protein
MVPAIAAIASGYPALSPVGRAPRAQAQKPMVESIAAD